MLTGYIYSIVICLIIYFSSTFVHELGHAIAFEFFYPGSVKKVHIGIIGGYIKLNEEFYDSKIKVIISLIAGPLFGAFYDGLILISLPNIYRMEIVLSAILLIINIFNLFSMVICGFTTDGGQIENVITDRNLKFSLSRIIICIILGMISMWQFLKFLEVENLI